MIFIRSGQILNGDKRFVYNTSFFRIDLLKAVSIHLKGLFLVYESILHIKYCVRHTLDLVNIS